MREDLYGSLKNAMERGASLEQAIRSLANAGYNEAEVREASKMLTEGAISFSTSAPTIPEVSEREPARNSAPQKIQQPIQMLPAASRIGIQPVQKGRGKIFLLSIILVILIALLVSTIFFKEEVIEIIDSLINSF